MAILALALGVGPNAAIQHCLCDLSCPDDVPARVTTGGRVDEGEGERILTSGNDCMQYAARARLGGR